MNEQCRQNPSYSGPRQCQNGTVGCTKDHGCYAIEQEIKAKGLTAPRITPDDIEAQIAGERFFTAWEGAQLAYWKDSDPMHPKSPEEAPDSEGPLSLLTFCVIVLRNGFTVTGESACASPENFDPEIGRKIARDNAINKIWTLMGYELRTKLASGD